MAMIGGGLDDPLMRHLDDNVAYPKRLRTSLSKIMDKQLEYSNIGNVVPMGSRTRSRSRSGSISGESGCSQAPITAMLRSSSPVRMGSVSMTERPPVQLPKMFKKEYLLKNNNSSQVIKNVPLGCKKDSVVKPIMLNPKQGHSRTTSTCSQMTNVTTKYVELDAPALGNRFPSSDSFASSSPTVTAELELRLLADEEAQLSGHSNKRQSILSNFMNDEQIWLNEKQDFQYPDDTYFDKERIDLTIKNLELRIDELKLDNDKLHLDNKNLKLENATLTKENESLAFQNKTLFNHMQSLPRISNADFIIRKQGRTENDPPVSEKLLLQSDELVKIAVEGKIKELEKDLARYKCIRKAVESRLSPRKSRFKYLTGEQLDALVEDDSDEHDTSLNNNATATKASGDKKTQVISTVKLKLNVELPPEQRSEFESESESESESAPSPTRLQNGFNLRLKLASPAKNDENYNQL